MGRVCLAVAVGAASTLAVVGTAAADPVNAPGAFLVPLACDDGASYEVVVNGNGEFGVGHDLASNAMLIPTAFGPFHGVITDDGGNVLEEFTDPPSTKGSSTKSRQTSISCTFVVDDTFTDPEFGVLHFQGEGSVVGFSTPAR
ncbi:MAG TPA: hypothetical protein VFZ72_21305 [Jiangellaceae bacterium]